jgi:phage-related protein
MEWHVTYYNKKVKEEAISLPPGIVAKLFHILDLLEEFGPYIGEPHVKSVSGKHNKGLFEMRPRGKEGIARVFFCTVVDKKIVVLHSYVKKGSVKHQQHEIDIAAKRMKELP